MKINNNNNNNNNIIKKVNNNNTANKNKINKLNPNKFNNNNKPNINNNKLNINNNKLINGKPINNKFKNNNNKLKDNNKLKFKNNKFNNNNNKLVNNKFINKNNIKSNKKNFKQKYKKKFVFKKNFPTPLISWLPFNHPVNRVDRSKIKKAVKTNKIIKKRYFGLLLKVSLSLNNVFVTLTRRESGKVLFSKHSGMIGYKGSKKKNPYVAGEVVKNLLTHLDKLGIQLHNIHVQLFMKAKTPFAFSISKQFYGFDVGSISVIRSVSHSLGLRQQKQRRI